ncbi:DUF58 domain-containing protein [Paenibacillus sp. MBLB2552]|uniref:DUF58 domain-containing protein n=1 Tax=Paenibacillus mellifer TaxID=2937794 RepID=A0A9X1Y055_9BACL|nr:DUF58 domain-containing protein [Paenibacillus mellifer]MCK8488910.1 DUF58 domain-containing protein [Paenibacillus mellifer]
MKNAGWAWPVAIVFAGAFGGWYTWRGGVSALFLLVLVGFIILQGVLVQALGPKRFKVERTWQPEFPVAGEPVTVNLKLRCEGGLPPIWLQVEDELAGAAAGQGTNRPGVRGGSLLFTGFRRDYRATYTIQGLPRGVYKDMTVQLFWGDSFGWFKRSRHAVATEVMVIHPLPLAANPPEAEERGEQEGGGAWRPQLIASSPTSGRLRPYAPGDPLRRIHWKYSAKKGELLSRIPEEQGVMPRYLLLSTRQGEYAASSSFELAVSAAATWLRREAGDSDAGELRFSHGALAGACRVTGREGMMNGLEQLAGLRLGNGLSAEELLRRDWSEVLSQGQSLTVITGTLTPELAGDLLHLAELGVTAEVWCAGGLSGLGQPMQLAARLRERGVMVADLTLYRKKSRRKEASEHVSA